MAEVRVQRIQIVWRGRAEQAIEAVLTQVPQGRRAGTASAGVF